MSISNGYKQGYHVLRALPWGGMLTPFQGLEKYSLFGNATGNFVFTQNI
jgi:hypothetical protein